MDDVAGEAAQAERETAGEIEEGAGGDEEGAEDQEGAAEVAGGVHGESLARGRLGWVLTEKNRSIASLGMTARIDCGLNVEIGVGATAGDMR